MQLLRLKLFDCNCNEQVLRMLEVLERYLTVKNKLMSGVVIPPFPGNCQLLIGTPRRFESRLKPITIRVSRNDLIRNFFKYTN